ncbi:phosphopantetheine-binding protein [Streptomyces sp. NPDC048527]|uniref:phosphopantetheine-binding protein n=1 Tax=Streptomyces sp. NPDC048527 TaxID=3365568 RepID=UPI00371DA2D5
MTREKILEVLCRHVLEVLGDLQDVEIHPEQNLRDLGANSLDRMDILIGAMDELRLDAPMPALVDAPTIGDLAELLLAHSVRP